MKSLFPILLAVSLVVHGCTQKSETLSQENPSFDSVSLLYAKGFRVTKNSQGTWVEIKQPYQGATKGFYYLMVPKGAKIPNHDEKYKVIRTPVSSIVCTSTTHIPLLDYLGVSTRLVGFPTTNYISSEITRKLIDEGKVSDLGVDNGLNIEKLYALKPEVVMGYTMTSEYGQFKKIEELGIPVVINSEYLERHPLGRAEWIKFVGILFNKEEKADSVFRVIENNYHKTSDLAKTVTAAPTAFSGIMYGDAWFLPGGKNYASTILSDAGLNYLWKDDPSHGFLQLSFESVYSKAVNCDYWIGVGSFQTLEELKAAENRYANFQAFKKKQVYSYNARTGAKGGNEYLELGYLRPDLILNDLVKIAHPELLPEYKLFFHKKLE